MIRLLLLKLESSLLDHVPDDVVGWLDTPLSGHVSEMVEERPEIDPAPAGFQNLGNQEDEVQDVVCTADKEAGSNAIL